MRFLFLVVVVLTAMLLGGCGAHIYAQAPGGGYSVGCYTEHSYAPGDPCRGAVARYRADHPPRPVHVHASTGGDCRNDFSCHESDCPAPGERGVGIEVTSYDPDHEPWHPSHD